MPSRHKKALHANRVTNNFFNQGDTFVCPCCNGRNQNHTLRPIDSSSDCAIAEAYLSEDDSKCSVIETNHRIGHERDASVTAFCKETFKDFTPRDREKLLSYHDVQKTIPDPEGIKRALRLAYKEMSDTLATADFAPPSDTFDLSDLKEVAKTYDLLCRSFQDEEERELEGMAGRIIKLGATALDVRCSPYDRLAARMDMRILDIRSKDTALTSCLRQAQLFNIDKKFGFVEESYQALSHEDRKQRGENVPAELPLSFRQKLNNPSKLVESASEQSKKKDKKKDKKKEKKKDKKKLKLEDALVEFQRNVKLMTGEFGKLKKTVNDAVKPIELPSRPSSFKYAGIPVPEDIPDHIQQRFFDASFALQEALILKPEACEHRRHVQGILMNWHNAGTKVWYVCFEMPFFNSRI